MTMTDIVKRLRGSRLTHVDHLFVEAADEIERLRQYAEDSYDTGYRQGHRTSAEIVRGFLWTEGNQNYLDGCEHNSALKEAAKAIEADHD